MSAVESVPAPGASLPPISAPAALHELQLQIGRALYYEHNPQNVSVEARALKRHEALARAHVLITLLVRA